LRDVSIRSEDIAETGCEGVGGLDWVQWRIIIQKDRTYLMLPMSKQQD